MTPSFLILKRQSGATLIIGMLTLAFLSIIGIFATTSSNLETKSASTDRNYKISFYAAELALQVGETSVQELLTRRDFNEGSVPGHYGQDELSAWHGVDWQNNAQVVSNIPSEFNKNIYPPKYTIEQRVFKRDSLTIGIGMTTGIYNFNVLGQGQDRSKKTQSHIETVYARRF